ncbi:MAG: cell division protein FtsZ [Candidatus Aenigmarchaeota archaeon]|nr:cell division protein FtsZ [Candidatus Aenigmarchaeota archaeon]
MDSIIQSAFDEQDKDDWSFQSPSSAQEEETVDQEFSQHTARILVIGVGGAGNNSITRLTEMGIAGAETIAVNTDAKHLSITKAQKKVLIGKELTKGLGAGGYPSIGKKAAEESRQDLKEMLGDVDLVFITCGLGGGTGTGAAPVIARIAKEQGAIVIGCVTLPFKIEGARIAKAEDGLIQLREVCDTVIVMENQKLLKLAGDLPLKQAFAMADDLIATMIKGISETISQPSLVNLDYADVKAVMRSGGVAAIGVGDSTSQHRAQEAVQKALSHPLLEVDYTGATGALIQIIGGEDMKLSEINDIGEAVAKNLDPDAQVIWGARILPEYENKIQVITIITGVKSPYILGPSQKRYTPDTQGVQRMISDLGIKVVS